MLVLSGPTRDDARAPTIVMSPEVRDPSERLLGRARSELFKTSLAFADFLLLEEAEMLVGGRPAVLARCTWTDDRGSFEQSTVWIDAPNAELFTIACVCAKGDGRGRAAFDEMVASLRFDVKAQNPEAPSTASPALPMGIPMPGERRRTA
jgi:hypothetical protein